CDGDKVGQRKNIQPGNRKQHDEKQKEGAGHVSHADQQQGRSNGDGRKTVKCKSSSRHYFFLAASFSAWNFVHSRFFSSISSGVISAKKYVSSARLVMLRSY